MNLYDIEIYFYYRCKGVDENGNCILHDEEKNRELNIYGFAFNYTGTKVDHHKENPLTTDFIHDYILFSIDDKMLNCHLKWKTIKYTEEKGISRLFINYSRYTRDW